MTEDSLPTPEQVFVGPAFPVLRPVNMGSSPEYSEVSSEYIAGSSEYSDQSDGERDSKGRLLIPHLDAPVIDDLAVLEESFRKSLEELAEELRQKERLGANHMERVILALCSDQFLTLSTLAQLVNRNPDGLRQQYLSKMVKSGEMLLAFPTKPTHERQAYRAAVGLSSNPDG